MSNKLFSTIKMLTLTSLYCGLLALTSNGSEIFQRHFQSVKTLIRTLKFEEIWRRNWNRQSLNWIWRTIGRTRPSRRRRNWETRWVNWELQEFKRKKIRSTTIEGLQKTLWSDWRCTRKWLPRWTWARFYLEYIDRNVGSGKDRRIASGPCRQSAA